MERNNVQYLIHTQCGLTGEKISVSTKVIVMIVVGRKVMS